MASRTTTLPVRLVPRKRLQIFVVIFCAFTVPFFGWFTISLVFSGQYLWALVPLIIALALASFGTGSLVRLLPGSPYYHLDVSGAGLTLRTPCAERHVPWPAAPFTVEGLSDAESGATYSAIARIGVEPLRLAAELYGTRNSFQGAADLAAWLNGLRDLALVGQLHADTQIELPPGLTCIALGRPGTGSPTASV